MKDALSNLPSKSGVYRFYDSDGEVIYVGKAKNLKKRVASYFRSNLSDNKTHALVRKIANIEVTVTANEVEALLLESNLIKKFRPRYNILFKDDKSYPYLLLSKHKFPRLFVYRGHKKMHADYFGPFPSAHALRDTVNFLYKTFLIRNCRDNFFSHRTRPCLQYQIGRCIAPCVNYVGVKEYQDNVNLLKKFLRGNSKDVIKKLRQVMKKTAQEKDYEKAAKLRDQINNLEQLLIPQRVERGRGNFDVIAIWEKFNSCVVQVLKVRLGSLVASKVYFPETTRFISASTEQFLEAFLLDYYLNDSLKDQVEIEVPDRIILNRKIASPTKLAEAITKALGKKVIVSPASRVKAAWVKMAEANAKEALKRRFMKQSEIESKFAELKKLLQLKVLKQIECFDISHTAGTATVASCVVFKETGPSKKDYRIFNIKTAKPGDDYAAMCEVLKRRFAYWSDGKRSLPEVILIDGGKGQLNIAARALGDLEFLDKICLLSIAKGEGRRPNLDTIYRFDQELNKVEMLNVDRDSQAFHLLQQIRDAAHRFAITRHRRARK